MRRGMWLAAGVLLLAGCAGGHGEAPTAAGEALQAHRDPATGRFVEVAPEVAARAAAVGGFGVGEPSAAGLVERRVGSPAGGFAVELGGRFRTYLVARRDGDGELAVSCGPEAGQAAAGSGGTPSLVDSEARP